MDNKPESIEKEHIPKKPIKDLLAQKMSDYPETLPHYSLNQAGGEFVGKYLGVKALMGVFGIEKSSRFEKKAEMVLPDSISLEQKKQLLAAYTDAYLQNALTTRPKITLKDLVTFQGKGKKEAADFRVAGNLTRYETIRDFLSQAGLEEEMLKKDQVLKQMVINNPDLLRKQLNEQSEAEARKSIRNLHDVTKSLTEMSNLTNQNESDN